MSWWDKLFKKEKGAVLANPAVDYSDKLVAFDNNVLKETMPVVVTENGKVVSAYEEKEEETVVSNLIVVDPLDLMSVTYKESPNKSSRAAGEDPSVLVLHHTGPGSFNGIVDWLCNPDAKASAHYVLGTGGQLTQLVNTKKKAWHAGKSKWDGRDDVSQFSIGIEICNVGILEKTESGDFVYEEGRTTKKYTGKVEPVLGQIVYPSGRVVAGYYIPYPEKQLEKLVALCKAIVQKYPQMTKDRIVTHFQIATPEGRKNDPFGLDMRRIVDSIFG